MKIKLGDKEKINILITALLVAVFIAITLSFTLAYLTATFENDPGDSTTIGTVATNLYYYNGSTYELLTPAVAEEPLEFTLNVTSKNTTVPLNLFIKNDGDIDTIAMLNIGVTYNDTLLLNTSNATFTNTGWVNMSTLDNAKYSANTVSYTEEFGGFTLPTNLFFNAYLNSKLTVAKGYVPVGSLLIKNEFAEEVSVANPLQLNFTISLQSVAHSANAYQYPEVQRLANPIGPFEYTYADSATPHFAQAFLNSVWTAWKADSI